MRATYFTLALISPWIIPLNIQGCCRHWQPPLLSHPSVSTPQNTHGQLAFFFIHLAAVSEPYCPRIVPRRVRITPHCCQPAGGLETPCPGESANGGSAVCVGRDKAGLRPAVAGLRPAVAGLLAGETRVRPVVLRDPQ